VQVDEFHIRLPHSLSLCTRWWSNIDKRHSCFSQLWKSSGGNGERRFL